MNLSSNKPIVAANLGAVTDHGAREAIRDTLRIVEELRNLLMVVINFNEISYIAQDTQPTLESGKTVIWKDTDASPGDPQAYIVTKRNGSTYTFASVETA